MRKRLLVFSIYLCFFGSMLLVALFPFQIGIAYLYGVNYDNPTTRHLIDLSSIYWTTLILPRFFRWLGKFLRAILGDVWIDIQNEISLLTHPLTNGKVRQTIWARLKGLLTLILTISMIWYYISSFLSFERAQSAVMVVWAVVVLTFMQFCRGELTQAEE